MTTKNEFNKEAWTEPNIYSIDFKETYGGTVPDANEGTDGTVSDLPG